MGKCSKCRNRNYNSTGTAANIGNRASGFASAAFGGQNYARGLQSFVVGNINIADGIYGAAFGSLNYVRGVSCFVAGNTLVQKNAYCTLIGYLNDDKLLIQKQKK